MNKIKEIPSFYEQLAASVSVPVDPVDQLIDFYQDESIVATPTELEEAQNIDQNWMEIAKTFFILFKIATISIMLTLAIIANRKRDGRFGLVTLMLFINICVLIGLFFFEVGNQYIPAFFLMIYAENYTNFLGFNILIRRLATPEGPQLKKRTNRYFIIMNLLYLSVFAMAFTRELGPWCKKWKLYPPVLSFAEFLFLINAVYHRYLHFYGYFLKWESDSQVKELLDTERQKGNERLKLVRKVFTKQMDTYVFFQTVLSCVAVAIQLWARVFVHTSDFLACSGYGFQWLHTSMMGALFVLFHMVLVCMQAFMIERVFYSVPNKAGYFKKESQQEEVVGHNESVQNITEVEAVTINQKLDESDNELKDNDFQRV